MERLIIGNLKMHLLSPVEREQYFKLFKKELKGKNFANSKIILCPPFLHLEAFKKALPKKIELGAQNMFWERKGSFTGEISPAMLKNFGCEYVIIGHSERRKYFLEKDEEISLKISAALKAGLSPIICVGESKVEKDGGRAHGVISSQVKNALSGVNRTKAENIIIAYEPVWAVGSDTLPTPDEIMGSRILIRKILTNMFGSKYAEKIKIIYGGSVSAATAGQACLEPGMGGVLVGRESLLPYEFFKIAEILNQ